MDIILEIEFSTNLAIRFSPLVDETIYYVHRLSRDTFKLTVFEWDALFSYPVKEIDLTTQGSNNRFSAVNPHIKDIAYSNVGFGVSHSSMKNLKLSFFEDGEFVNEFEGTNTSFQNEIERIGTPGVTNDAVVNLKFNSNFPNSLFYQLQPTDVDSITDDGEVDKLKILPDLAKKSLNSNRLDLVFSGYNGDYEVNISDQNTFNIVLTDDPERTYYDDTDLSKSSYSTESENYFESINSLKLTQKSSSLKKVPQVVSVASTVGSGGSNIYFVGEEIGNIKKVDISNVGFEFSSDKTLKPIADIPTVIGISNYHSIENIEVIDSGRDYSTPPNIAIYDSELNQVMDDVITRVSVLGSSVSDVSIINGGSGLSDTNISNLSVSIIQME